MVIVYPCLPQSAVALSSVIWYDWLALQSTASVIGPDSKFRRFFKRHDVVQSRFTSHVQDRTTRAATTCWIEASKGDDDRAAAGCDQEVLFRANISG